MYPLPVTAAGRRRTLASSRGWGIISRFTVVYPLRFAPRFWATVKAFRKTSGSTTAEPTLR